MRYHAINTVQTQGQMHVQMFRAEAYYEKPLRPGGKGKVVAH